MQKNLNVDNLVKEIKQKQTININEYRLLTGACSQGVQNFLDEMKITDNELPLNKVIEITNGRYGHNKLLELFK